MQPHCLPSGGGGLQLGMLAWSWRFAVQCLFLSVTRWTWLGVFNVIARVFNMEAGCPVSEMGHAYAKPQKWLRTDVKKTDLLRVSFCGC